MLLSKELKNQTFDTDDIWEAYKKASRYRDIPTYSRISSEYKLIKIDNAMKEKTLSIEKVNEVPDVEDQVVKTLKEIEEKGEDFILDTLIEMNLMFFHDGTVYNKMYESVW